jgi:hypothetical protein
MTNQYSQSQERQIYPPKDAYYFFPHGKDVIEFKESNMKKLQRYIFEGSVEYLPFEREKIIELTNEIIRNGLQFPADWRESETLRILQANKFDIRKSLESFKNYMKFKIEKDIIVRTENIAQILELGFFYMYGRDSRFRPLLIIDCNAYLDNVRNFQFHEWEQAMIYFLNYCIKHLLIPGQVETWNIICDVGRINILNVPEDLRKFMINLQEYFKCRMHMLYLVGLSGFVNLIWRFLKSAIDEAVVKKITLITKSQRRELFNHINPMQVERKFGGYSSNLRRGEFFPPRDPCDEYLLPNEIRSSILVSEEEYLRIASWNKNITLSPYLFPQGQVQQQQKLTLFEEIRDIDYNLNTIEQNQIEEDDSESEGIIS